MTSAPALVPSGRALDLSLDNETGSDPTTGDGADPLTVDPTQLPKKPTVIRSPGALGLTDPGSGIAGLAPAEWNKSHAVVVPVNPDRFLTGSASSAPAGDGVPTQPIKVGVATVTPKKDPPPANPPPQDPPKADPPKAETPPADPPKDPPASPPLTNPSGWEQEFPEEVAAQQEEARRRAAPGGSTPPPQDPPTHGPLRETPGPGGILVGTAEPPPPQKPSTSTRTSFTFYPAPIDVETLVANAEADVWNGIAKALEQERIQTAKDDRNRAIIRRQQDKHDQLVEQINKSVDSHARLEKHDLQQERAERVLKPNGHNGPDLA